MHEFVALLRVIFSVFYKVLAYINLSQIKLFTHQEEVFSVEDTDMVN